MLEITEGFLAPLLKLESAKIAHMGWSVNKKALMSSFICSSIKEAINKHYISEVYGIDNDKLCYYIKSCIETLVQIK